jgi:hypothetical protein
MHTINSYLLCIHMHIHIIILNNIHIYILNTFVYMYIYTYIIYLCIFIYIYVKKKTIAFAWAFTQYNMYTSQMIYDVQQSKTCIIYIYTRQMHDIYTYTPRNF